jgi:hypothetical protein
MIFLEGHDEAHLIATGNRVAALAALRVEYRAGADAGALATTFQPTYRSTY